MIIRSLLTGPERFDEVAASLASDHLRVHPVLSSRVRYLHAFAAQRLVGERPRPGRGLGEIDLTTPLDMGTAVAAALTGTWFSEIPDCGHCPQLERPDALVAETDRIRAKLVT